MKQKAYKYFSAANTKNIYLYVGLGMLALLTFWYFYFVSSRFSLRLDETQSLLQSTQTLSGMLETVAKDVHVPLYHTLLHFWLQYVGNDTITVRLLSYVFFALSLPAVYILAMRAYDNKAVAFLSSLLVALSPFMNWYGSEARMYSLLMLLTTLNQYYFLGFLKENKKHANWIGYALTGLLGIYTHYFFFFMLATQAVFFLFNKKEFLTGALKKFIAVAALLLIAIAPWMYYFFKLGSGNNIKPRLADPTSVDVFNTYSQFLFGFQTDTINTILVSFWPILVLLSFLLLRRNFKVTTPTLYFILAAILPIALAFIVSIVGRPFYLSRYLIVCLPPLFILFSYFLSQYSRPVRYTVASVIIITMATTLSIQTLSGATPTKENYQSAVEYLDEKATVQDVVVASAPFTIYPVEYYYKGAAELDTLPRWPDRFDGEGIPAFSESELPTQVDQLVEDHETIWVLLSFDQGYEDTIDQYFKNNYEQLDMQEFSDGMTLYQYKINYDPKLTIPTFKETKRGQS